jgi:hypothetical protein
MRPRMSVVATVVCVLVTVTSAQVDRGRIVGVITDAAGAALPGVTVTLSGAESWTAITNERGEFSFDRLAPGKYTMHAVLPGFRELIREVSVSVDRALRLTLQMEVGALQETVRVTGETPLSARGAAVAGGTPAGIAAPPAAAPQSARTYGSRKRTCRDSLADTSSQLRPARQNSAEPEIDVRSAFAVAAVALALPAPRLGPSGPIRCSGATHVVAFAELPAYASPHVPLVSASLDQLSFCCATLCHLQTSARSGVQPRCRTMGRGLEIGKDRDD